MVQVGLEDEQDYYSSIFRGNVPSAWNQFPTKEKPEGRYKYTSVGINFSQDSLLVNRQTYSILDWLGDIGGLLDALYLIGFVFISPLASYAMNSKLLSTLFRYKGSDESLYERTDTWNKLDYTKSEKLNRQMSDDTQVDDIKVDFQKYKSIKRISICNKQIFCRSNYRKMMNKASSMLNKELDLRKFIYRQRVQTTAILGLLSGRQTFFVDKMSQMVIRESSNLDETSSDSELSDWQKDNMDYANRMVRSSSKVDNRLINLYRLRQAEHRGVRVGLKNPQFVLDWRRGAKPLGVYS